MRLFKIWRPVRLFKIWRSVRLFFNAWRGRAENAVTARVNPDLKDEKTNRIADGYIKPLADDCTNRNTYGYIKSLADGCTNRNTYG